MTSPDLELEARRAPTGIRPEDLAAQYADRWVIYRDLCRDGTHDEWVAEPRQPTDGVPEKITAGDIEALAEQLAAADVITMDGPREGSRDADLRAMRDLQERWSPAWTIWRSSGDGEPKSWCATHRGRGPEVSMTLMEPTADALEQALVREADRTAIHG